MIKSELKPLLKPLSMHVEKFDWSSVNEEIEVSKNTFIELTKKLESISENAGTNNNAYRKAHEQVMDAISQNRPLQQAIDSKLKVRALGLILITPNSKKIPLTKELLGHIDRIRPQPSPLFIQHVIRFYFTHYDQLVDLNGVGAWLISAAQHTPRLKPINTKLFQPDGAKWVAENASKQKQNLKDYLHYLGLEAYTSGRFMHITKQIYYIEELKNIPANQPHELLNELQKKEVYESLYDGNSLLGHEILRIIIDRAPDNGVHDTWRNLVMEIAGDPRVSKSHDRHLKWWQHLDERLKRKVIGWLSRFDLRLFLEALKYYSDHSNNDELKRMYPARQQFLEGLLELKLVTHTRLYLSPSFIRFLHRNYKKEHLPDYSRISNSDKDIVYVDLKGAHLIEGTHNCKLWIYKTLSDKAIVFKYNKILVSYEDLTSGLVGRGDIDSSLVKSITHHPNITWQYQAISALKKIRVPIHPEAVLTEEDYYQYKRKYGVTHEY